MGGILLGILLSVALLVMVAVPVVIEQIKAADRTYALSNLKQLNFSLIDFDNDYGRFPDDTTIPMVKASTHTTIPLGTKTSNDYFRQLVAVGNSEKFLWAKTTTTPRKPDGNITGTHAVEKGECSYAYVAGLSSSDDPGTPLAMTPMLPGTEQFDPDVFGDKAVILRIDGSAKPETIRTDNRKVSVQGGRTLFEPGMWYWNGKKPDLKWAE